MPSRTESKELYPASIDSSMCKYASVSSSYPLTRPIGNSSAGTTYSQINLTTGSNAETYVLYKFDCSVIPADATIDSVTCSAKAYISNTTSNRITNRTIQLYYGTNTAKGSASTVSTSTTAFNMTCGTWTRNELNNCYIRLYGKRGTSNTTTTYYFRFYGATLTIKYTYNYQTYTVTTSLNGKGTINPSGNTEVEEGLGFSLNIAPEKANDEIKVTDNGVDVTNQLVDGPQQYAFDVNTKSGASYGFQQNYDSNCREGWWQSTNKGKASSASVATVSFTITKVTTVTINLICYAEATYDYFLIGPLNGSLSTSASADSNAVFTTKNSNSTNVQTYSFSNLNPGTYTFDVKYYKDSYTDSNWDSAQFTLTMEPTNSPTGTKVYNLDNVRAAHNIVVTIGSQEGETLFIKNTDWKDCQLFKKVNNAWVLQTDYSSVLTEQIYIMG